jgi:hypothetical protein
MNFVTVSVTISNLTPKIIIPDINRNVAMVPTIIPIAMCVI